jgi:hypothetical protein
MSQTVQIKHISGNLSALNALQIGVQSAPDGDLGFKTWGGKDADGMLTQWLSKGKAGILKSLEITDLAESGSGDASVIVGADGAMKKGGDPYKVRVDEDDPLEKYLFDKILTTSELAKNIEAVGGLGDSYEAIRLSLVNATYYVKGNSIYGGTLTDNLNTLGRNTPFTCLGTATGVPDASYSWFGWHINSNAGTAAAAQIAYAFNSSAIICYERVKTSGTWGAWKLRGSTMQIQTFGSGALTAFPGIFYIASSVTDLVLTLAPSIGGEYHLKFTTAAMIGTIDLSSVTSWIGSAPSIAAGKTYELDILDGVGVIAEVS